MRAPQTPDEIESLIAQGQGLTTVFARRVSPAYINERRVIEMMGCMANAGGGTLLIGVDKDGTVSGCYPFHGDRTDPDLLAATVFRYTSPGLPVTVTVTESDPAVVAVTTEPQPTPVATAWGSYRTRRLNAQGVAECAGMDPAYLFTRYRDANGMDWALVGAPGASTSELDPEAIAAFRIHTSDERLAQLDDAALTRALGFLDDSIDPVALGAIAMFGTPDALRRHLPHHHLTVVDRRTGRTWRGSAPLALMLADLHSNRQTIGTAFPLVINALLHRDYFMPGPVYVALDSDGATVTSPGAAPRGVDLARAAAGRPTYAPRSLYLTTAVAKMGLTPGAGEGLAQLSEVSFAGSHDQGVVASLRWEALGELNDNERAALAAVREVRDGASSSEIARAAGLSTQQAYRALRKLVDAGRVRKTGETRMTRYFPA